MREEKYIIDENGKKKLIEINQSRIADEKRNNISPKPRYHRNNPKIIIINDNNDKKIIRRYKTILSK